MNDLDLLRRYEPVIKYTRGELFYPFSVEDYVERCSLWMRDPNGIETKLADASELTLEKLAVFDHIPPDHRLFLRFVQEPLHGLAYQMWLTRTQQYEFKAPGRLARVGFFSRLFDALFDLSLVMRGKVPGGTTAAAEVQSRMAQRGNPPQFPYYARVRHEGGYIILHYLYFYAMNNWRSTFSGVNDHEADWEQVFVYLSDEPEPSPLWVAYASHDFLGDDLRRRWDDPELQKYAETHPVVFAGAGSHASYFLPGEYLMQVQPQFLQPVTRIINRAAEFFAEQFGWGYTEEERREIELFFSIPFIDYARGDGLLIGTEAAQWSPTLLTGNEGWVERYRGLWGLDTKDLLGGERAPAGPKFNRDGTVRQAWHNPLGWSGLNKVPPPAEAARTLENHLRDLQQSHLEIEQHIEKQRELLRLLGLETQSLQAAEYLEKLNIDRQRKVKAQADKLDALYQRRAELSETLQAGQLYLEQLRRGDLGAPQAHIQHKHRPEEPQRSASRLVEFWAAVSSGLLMVVFVISVIVSPGNWVIRLVLVLSVFALIEAALRRRFGRLLSNMTIALAIVSAGILAIDFIDWLVLIGLIVAAYLLTSENLKELRG